MPSITDRAARPAPEALRYAAARADDLERWLGVEFAVVDPAAAQLLHGRNGLASGGWRGWLTLCDEALRVGQPRIQPCGDLAARVAVPLTWAPDLRLVAIGGYLLRPIGEEEYPELASALDLEPGQVRQWLSRHAPTPLAVVQQLCELIFARLAADARVASLEGELEKLTVHLAAMYEEISLVFRLTQNLKISHKPEELAQVVVRSLLELVPAQGLAVLLADHGDEPPSGADPSGDAAGERLVHAGHVPVDAAGLRRLAQHLGAPPVGGAIVVNDVSARGPDWPAPQVRQLVLVPVSDGEHHSGWMAAVNHSQGAEFGSVEADLLASVAAILGIHGGNTALYREQAELLAGIVRALTSAIDAKDPYTCGHSDRVARVAVRLAQELDCPPEVRETIYLSGLLHDVGKIGIDDNVLRKPGKLTDAEYEHIKTHTRVGFNILKDLKKLEQILPVVLSHHESWDGRGYPDGLAAEQIPYLARIVAVADAFDAMGSDRPYRKGMDDEKMEQILRAGAGQQWDPHVVEAFFRAREDIHEISRRPAQDRPPELAELA